MNRNIKNYRAVKAAIKQWEKREIKHAVSIAADPERAEYARENAASRVLFVRTQAAKLLDGVEAANKAPRLEGLDIDLSWRKGVYGWQARAEGRISWEGGSLWTRSQWTTGWGYDKESTAAADMLACVDRRGECKETKEKNAIARAVLARVLIENWGRVSKLYPFRIDSIDSAWLSLQFSFSALCGVGMSCFTELFARRFRGYKTPLPGYRLYYRNEKYYIVERVRRGSASK